MKIEIFGNGCPKCHQLEANAKKAVEELKIKANILKVTDIGKIVAAGIMMTPALGVNGKVVSSGKILTAKEIIKFLK
jgi:small redox-active disulfide protein 2